MTDNTTTTSTEPVAKIFQTFNGLGVSADLPYDNRAERRRKSKKMRYCKIHKILSKDHTCEGTK